MLGSYTRDPSEALLTQWVCILCLYTCVCLCMFQCTCVCKCTPGALSSSSGISPSPVSVPWTHHCQFCTELPVVDSLTVLCRVAGREGSAAKGHSGLKLHQRLLRYLGSGYSLNTKTFLIHGLLSLETDNLC